MKKLVPDPPDFNLDDPTEISAGDHPEHPPLFSVRAGIRAENALVQASLYLNCAATAGAQAAGLSGEPARDVARVTVHLVEMAKALVDAVLTGYGQNDVKG